MTDKEENQGPADSEEPLLVPSAAEGPAEEPPPEEAPAPRKARISPRNAVWLAIAGGGLLMGGLILAIGVAREEDLPRRPQLAVPGSVAVFENAQGAMVTFVAEPDAGAPAEPSGQAARPVVFRVASMAGDAVDLALGTVGKRTLAAALAASGVIRSEAQRVAHSAEHVKDLHLGPKDTFTVARDKASGRVLAFELSASPVDVWQAKDSGGSLELQKLDLHLERKRVAVAVTLTDDLRTSITRAGLDDDLMKLLGDALEGHVDVGSLRAGARLRIVATEERIDGAFARYAALDAVEYFPPQAGQTPTRVYWYARGGLPPLHAESDDETPRRKHKSKGGYYDAKGRQPFHGGWRTPIPLARVTSRFNPHRMHPVLHVVMPHNGVDFGAVTGTPIYATAAGVVRSAGDGGPCGNMVQILHPNGLTSVYCHMSRFAAGLHAGQHVEGRQLIGYVGQTGRVTGPHLHFAIKRGETFIDPLSLRLDGVRVLPRADREEFAKRRSELDAALEAIAVPAGSSVSADAGADDGGEPEIFYEEPPK